MDKNEEQIQNNIIRNSWHNIEQFINREYWTFVDGSNGHYEISNWGRIRNASSKRLLKLQWNDVRNDYSFNLHYQDKEKKVFLKKLLYQHFIGDLKKSTRIYLKSEDDGIIINNLILDKNMKE